MKSGIIRPSTIDAQPSTRCALVWFIQDTTFVGEGRAVFFFPLDFMNNSPGTPRATGWIDYLEVTGPC
jgi:hypothetical protein